MFEDTDLRRQYDMSENIHTESHRESPFHIVYIHCDANLGVHVYNLGQVMNDNLNFHDFDPPPPITVPNGFSNIHIMFQALRYLFLNNMLLPDIPF